MTSNTHMIEITHNDDSYGESSGDDHAEPPSTTMRDISTHSTQDKNEDTAPEPSGFTGLIKRMFGKKSDPNLRETLEEAIEDEDFNAEEDGISAHEKTLISNILKLKDLNVTDIMVPRADIVAISVDSTQEELLALLAEKQYNRIPIYKDSLDDMLGTIHIKDVLAKLAKSKTIKIKELVREIPIVSPSMPLLDLMLHMQRTHKHMAFVVDEFGGIDGLVTLGETIESIVGEIEDEYDQNESPTLERVDKNTALADARYDLEEFEEEFGAFLTEDEREENDTLGGLIMYIAGRVPARGEVIKHESGALFEILDADPRKINRIRIKNIPHEIP